MSVFLSLCIMVRYLFVIVHNETIIIFFFYWSSKLSKVLIKMLSYAMIKYLCLYPQCIVYV